MKVFIDQRTCRARGDQMKVTEKILVMVDKVQHLLLFLVMGNQCDSLHVTTPFFDVSSYSLQYRTFSV